MCVDALFSYKLAADELHTMVDVVKAQLVINLWCATSVFWLDPRLSALDSLLQESLDATFGEISLLFSSLNCFLLWFRVWDAYFAATLISISREEDRFEFFEFLRSNWLRTCRDNTSLESEMDTTSKGRLHYILYLSVALYSCGALNWIWESR